MNDELESISDKLEALSKKLDEMCLEYTRDKRDNRSYMLWAFTVAVVSITTLIPHPVNIAVTAGFFILGWVMWIRARKVTASRESMNEK